MELQEIRLELLKLTHSLGRTAAEAVERAKEMEQYINSVPEVKDDKKRQVARPAVTAGKTAL